MQTDVECPYGRGPMVAVSLFGVQEAMHEYRKTANKYIASKGGFFENQVWEEFTSLNDSVKEDVDFLSTFGSEYVSKSAKELGKERASIWKEWKEHRSFKSKSTTQGESSKTNVQGDQSKMADHSQKRANKLGTSRNDGKSKAELLYLREAREAVEKYIKVCDKEIREKCDKSWSLLSGGLETTDDDYKETRDIIKKAIEIASNNEIDESKKGEKKAVEGLLNKLRKIWQDARLSSPKP